MTEPTTKAARDVIEESLRFSREEDGRSAEAIQRAVHRHDQGAGGRAVDCRNRAA